MKPIHFFIYKKNKKNVLFIWRHWSNRLERYCKSEIFKFHIPHYRSIGSQNVSWVESEII